MQSFSHTSCYQLLRALPPAIRTYSTTHPRFQPSLPLTSPSQPNANTKPSTAKPAHQWSEENATISEEDVLADRDAITAELHSAKVQREIAAFGDGGWKKADWAD